MILHHSKGKYRIKVLLDTGCLTALINKQTVKKLGKKRCKHRQTPSIKNYMGERSNALPRQQGHQSS